MQVLFLEEDGTEKDTKEKRKKAKHPSRAHLNRSTHESLLRALRHETFK